MDIQSQEYFNELVEKSPEDLSFEEIGFLKARRSYLDPVQKEIFGKVLGLTVEEKPLSKARKEEVVEPTPIEPVADEPKEEPKVAPKKTTKKK